MRAVLIMLLAVSVGCVGEPLKCYEAWVSDYPQCRDYEKNGYICKGGWCVTDICRGDCTACSTERVGYVPNFTVARCEASPFNQLSTFASNPTYIFAACGVASVLLLLSWFPIVSGWLIFFSTFLFPDPYIVPSQLLIVSFIAYRLACKPNLFSFVISVAIAYLLHSYYGLGESAKLLVNEEMMQKAERGFKDAASMAAFSASTVASLLGDVISKIGKNNG